MPLLDELGLPGYEHVIFERSPLALAACQIDFPPILGVTDQVKVAPFQDDLIERYPILVTPPPSAGFSVTFTPMGQQAQQFPQWHFTDKERNWSAVLTPERLVLETRAYEHFGAFRAHLSSLLQALVKHFRPQVATRIGVRYINEVREFEGVAVTPIRPGLMGVSGIAEWGERTSHYMQEVRLEFSEHQAIILRLGMLPGGSFVLARPGEAQPPGKFHLLDFDVSRIFPTTEEPTMDSETICAYVDEYHEAIGRLFRWAITEEFVEWMGGSVHAG